MKSGNVIITVTAIIIDHATLLAEMAIRKSTARLTSAGNVIGGKGKTATIHRMTLVEQVSTKRGARTVTQNIAKGTRLLERLKLHQRSEPGTGKQLWELEARCWTKQQ